MLSKPVSQSVSQFSTIMSTNNAILLLVLSISCLCSTRDVYILRLGRWCFSNSFGLVAVLDLQELVVFSNLTNAVFEGDGRMEQGFLETVWQSTTGIAFVDSQSSQRVASVMSAPQLVMVMYLKVMLELSTKAIPVLECSVHALDDHCRLPDGLKKALLHSPITFKHSVSQVTEHHKFLKI